MVWDGTGEASGKPLDYSNIQVLGICGEKKLKLLSIWLDEADGILPPSARQILKKGCASRQIRHFALLQGKCSYCMCLAAGRCYQVPSALCWVKYTYMHGDGRRWRWKSTMVSRALWGRCSQQGVHFTSHFGVHDAEMLQCMRNGQNRLKLEEITGQGLGKVEC